MTEEALLERLTSMGASEGEHVTCVLIFCRDTCQTLASCSEIVERVSMSAGISNPADRRGAAAAEARIIQCSRVFRQAALQGWNATRLEKELKQV